MASSVITAPPRRRGRVAAHDLETLLDLTAAVAHAAEQVGAVAAAARVSMPVFDVIKRTVERRPRHRRR